MSEFDRKVAIDRVRTLAQEPFAARYMLMLALDMLGTPQINEILQSELRVSEGVISEVAKAYAELASERPYDPRD